MTFVNKIKSALDPENTKINLKFEKRYGLIPEMIKNIEEANIRFISSVVLYNGSLKDREKLRLVMKQIFKDSKKLLAKKIDKFALLYESKNPQFFKEYSKVREQQLSKTIPEIKHPDIEVPDPKNDDSEIESVEVKSRRKTTHKTTPKTEIQK